MAAVIADTIKFEFIQFSMLLEYVIVFLGEAFAYAMFTHFTAVFFTGPETNYKQTSMIRGLLLLLLLPLLTYQHVTR